MAETLLARTHPLQAWEAAFAALPPTVAVTVQPYVAMANVRLALETVDKAGLNLPSEPNTWVEVNGGRAIWLGPDEWLLTGVKLAPVAAPGGAVTDVSAQRITLRLSGERVRDVLAKGCSIDLHPRVFGRGRSAQSTLGQAGVVLLALSDTGDDFLVIVRSSFAGYLADWLLDATLEFS